jgi:hypothetical protein
MAVKQLIGRIIIALIRASIRAFFGMLIGVAIVSITLVILLFSGVLIPSVGSETMVFEIVGLLIAGACIGAMAGFFNMVNRRVTPNNQYEEREKNNNWHKK